MRNFAYLLRLKLNCSRVKQKFSPFDVMVAEQNQTDLGFVKSRASPSENKQIICLLYSYY